jgi:hypothetical protein
MEAVLRDAALKVAIQNEEHVPRLVEALCQLTHLKVSPADSVFREAVHQSLSYSSCPE